MMMMVKNIRTSITSRLLVVLLQVHQKRPPPRLHNSRIILSTSVAVPSIFGPKFAALLPGIYKKTRGTGGGLGVPPPPVVSSSSHLTHLSASSSPKRNCRLLALLAQSRFDRRNNNTKESAGDKQNQFYSTDFVDLLVDHHHNHHRQDHILDYQPVTFRCVANFTTSNRTWLNTSYNLWSFRTLLKAPTTCPIRTFSLSSVFNSKNMSHDSGSVPGNVDGNIQDMRKPYRHGSDTFDIKDLSSRDPMTQFGIWFNEAKKHPDIKEPNAIALATASRTGQPSVRMVLLKGFCKEGFKFFTNYDSRKGQELLENPLCSVCLHWEPLNRSVRIDGKVVRLSEEESTRYFQCRPRPSQLGAAVSDQSIVIPSREYLMNKYEELEKKYRNEEIIPKPDFWGGYLIEPFTIEFWQGQTTRVHDRLRFRKKQPDEVLDPELTHEGENGWVIERLSP